jgi:hypothetical protein
MSDAVGTGVNWYSWFGGFFVGVGAGALAYALILRWLGLIR